MQQHNSSQIRLNVQTMTLVGVMFFLLWAAIPARAQFSIRADQADAASNAVKVRVQISGVAGDELGGWIEAFGFEQQIVTANDTTAGGIASGRPQLSPLTILKGLDSASPRLLAVAVTGQRLRDVRIDLLRKNARTGTDETYFTIVLSDATVTGLRPQAPNQNDAQSSQLGAFEQVSFSYTKIQFIAYRPDGGTVTAGYDAREARRF